eukprot:1177068-Prymnesium_polylepis.2
MSPSDNGFSSHLSSASHDTAVRERHSVGGLPHEIKVAVPSPATFTLHCSRDTCIFCATMFHRPSTISSLVHTVYGRSRYGSRWADPSR